MLTLKLTPAQRSAVGTYITESIHEEDYPEASLHGSILTFNSTYERAADILIEASNSADVGDGHRSDARARKALDNVSDKLRKMQRASTT